MAKLVPLALMLVLTVASDRNAGVMQASLTSARPPSARALSTGSVALSLDKRRVRPDGTIRVRIVNSSAHAIGYGNQYGLTRRAGGSWIGVGSQPPVFAPRFTLEPSTTSQWQSVHIPRRAVRGHYRIQKWVEPLGGRRITISSEFRVVARQS